MHGPIASRASLRPEPGWSDTLASVAIHVVVDASGKFSPDLRGHFWEPQLDALHLNASITDISDAPLNFSVVGPWIIPPYCVRNGIDSDPGHCHRNIESWAQFARLEVAKRWDFKISQDSFVNVANLIRLINSLELTIDPMVEPYFRKSDTGRPDG
jgi:hypothetical protein